MSLCASGILMAALTTGLLLSDIMYRHSNRLITHGFLGGIITFLFFVLCERGYEIINWIFLAIIPAYIFIKLIFFNGPVSIIDSTEEIGSCNMPKTECSCIQEKPLSCVLPSPLSPASISSPAVVPLPPPVIKNCPANPIRLSTECGISRFSNYN